MAASPAFEDHDGELMDSLELVQFAQGGDRTALAELFARYYPRVRELVQRRLRSQPVQGLEAEDHLQDAMLDAIRGFDAFQARSKGELIAWFARVVENRITSAHRHAHAQKRDRAREVPLDGVRQWVEESAAGFQPTAIGTSPSQAAAERENDSILGAALAALGDEQRRIIELRNGRGLSWAEIAQTLPCASPDGARMQYVRARRALERELERRGGTLS